MAAVVPLWHLEAWQHPQHQSEASVTATWSRAWTPARL